MRSQVALVFIIGTGAPILAGIDVHLEMHIVQVNKQCCRVYVSILAVWVRALKGQFLLRSVYHPYVRSKNKLVRKLFATLMAGVRFTLVRSHVSCQWWSRWKLYFAHFAFNLNMIHFVVTLI